MTILTICCAIYIRIYDHKHNVKFYREFRKQILIVRYESFNSLCSLNSEIVNYSTNIIAQIISENMCSHKFIQGTNVIQYRKKQINKHNVQVVRTILCI